MNSTQGSQKPSGGTTTISNDEVKRLLEMGFKAAIIYKAVEIAKKENKNILDVVIQLQDSEEATPSGPSSTQNGNSSIRRKESLIDSAKDNSQGTVGINNSNGKQKTGDLDVLTIDVRLRSAGTPVGLMNYGNSKEIRCQIFMIWFGFPKN